MKEDACFEIDLTSQMGSEEEQEDDDTHQEPAGRDSSSRRRARTKPVRQRSRNQRQVEASPDESEPEVPNSRRRGNVRIQRNATAEAVNARRGRMQQRREIQRTRTQTQREASPEEIDTSSAGKQQEESRQEFNTSGAEKEREEFAEDIDALSAKEKHEVSCEAIDATSARKQDEVSHAEIDASSDEEQREASLELDASSAEEQLELPKRESSVEFDASSAEQFELPNHEAGFEIPRAGTYKATASQIDIGLPSGMLDPFLLQWCSFFKHICKPGQKTLGPHELQDVLKEIGREDEFTLSELQQLLGDADYNEDGIVDLTDFLVTMLRCHPQRSREQEKDDAFKLFDRDGDGWVTAEDLHEVSGKDAEGKDRCSLEEARDMIREAVGDVEDAMDEAAFKRMMAK